MAEQKPAAEGQAKAKKKSPQAEKKQKQKSGWTMERCTKAAKRYTSLDAWKQGAPSSYKAADARGWLKECAKFLTPKDLPKSNGLKIKKSA